MNPSVTSKIALTLIATLTVWSIAALATVSLTAPPETPHAKHQEAYVPSARVTELMEKQQANPQSVPAALALAEAYVADGRQSAQAQPYIEALKLYRQVLDKEPENPAALRATGEINLSIGLASAAIEAFEKLLKAHPDSHDVQISLGLAYLQLGNTQQALSTLQHAVELKPGDFRALLSLALAQRVAGDEAAVIQTAEKALAAAPDDTARDVVKRLLREMPAAEAQPGTRGEIEAQLRQHPILGPKLTRVEWGNNELQLFLREFPVEHMPPMARDRLTTRLQELLSATEVSAVTLRDEMSSAELLHIDIQPGSPPPPGATANP